ncbi:mucin-3A-like isoform X2 [Dysidea avara]
MAMQFIEGDECQVWIEYRKEKKIFDGVIRATNPSLGKHRVFINDLNKTVDVKHQDFNVLSLVGGRKSASSKHPDWFKHASSKKKTGDKSMAAGRATKGSERNKTLEKVTTTFLQPSHRKRRDHLTVGRANNEEVDPELQEQLRLIELQDKDSAFPALTSQAVKTAGDQLDIITPVTCSAAVVTTSNVSVFSTIITSSLPSSVVPKVKPLHQSKQQPKQPSSTTIISQTPSAWQQQHQQQSKSNSHNSTTLFSSVRDSTSLPLTNAEEFNSVKSPTVTTSAASNAKSVTVTKKGTYTTTQSGSLQHTDVAKQLVKAIHKEKENQQVSERQLLSLSMTASLTNTSQQQQTSWPELLSQDEQKAMPSEQQKLVPRSFHTSVSKSPLQAVPIVNTMTRMSSTIANPAKAPNSYFGVTQAPPTTAAQATPIIIRGPSVTVTSTVTHTVKPSSVSVVASVTTPTTSRACIPSFSVPTSVVRVTGNTLNSTLAPVAATASSVSLPATAAVTTPPHVGNATFNLEMPVVQLPQPPFQLYMNGENNLFFEEYGKMCFGILLENCPGIAHMVRAGVAGMPARSHVHDIDYSEEEKRLIEEQSQRLETWKKSPSGVLRTLKDLQGSPQSGEYPPQSGEHPSQFGEYPLQSGDYLMNTNLSAPQSDSDNTRKLQIMFPAQQQQLSVPREDFYLKKLNKEEVEMLQSLMKKMDIQQQQPTADTVATGGTSSEETVSAHTTSSIPPSDTEGTPSTASEPAMQVAPPTQSAPEPYSSESQSAGSSATPPDEVQTTSEEVDKQETTEQEDNTAEKQREDPTVDQYGNLDGDGLMYPGMMAPNPMAAMATMGHFLPPAAAAAGFMLPAPMINPYLFPPQMQMYFQMMQQQQAHMMMQQSMAAAAVATSPTPNSIHDEDYQQKNSQELAAAATVPQDVHQAEVNVNAVEVTSSNEHSNEEQLRGHSPVPPAEVHTNFSPIQNSFSAPLQVDSLPETATIATLKQQTLMQQQDLIPPSFTNSLSPPHSALLSNEDTINHQLLPSTVSHPASNNTFKQPKATVTTPDMQQQHKKMHNSSSEHFMNSKLTTNKEMPKHFAKHYRGSTSITSSRTNNNGTQHMWKQQHSVSKYDKHSYTMKAPQYYSQYDGETIDHELSQMGMNNNFPHGIPSMMFSSERRKPQT